MLITVNFGSASTGLIGSVYYTILYPDKSVYQSRRTDGITELVAGTGNYGVTVADATLSGKTVIWEINGTSKAASETFTGTTTGTGAISTEIIVEDENGAKLDGVSCWITSDVTGRNIVAGTLYTNALGSVTFMLDAGSYYLWRQRSGINFVNPILIMVT